MGERHLSVYQANDTIVSLAITDSAGAAYNLTGKVLEMYLKPSKAAADNDAAAVKLSTATTGITVTNATAGLADATIPAANATTAGTRWYRVDVIDAGKRSTALYGPLYTLDT